jgi:hypothetical protein
LSVVRVTDVVTKGLPSRSPPIQEPNWKKGGTSKRVSGYECFSADSNPVSIFGAISNKVSSKKWSPR